MVFGRIKAQNSVFQRTKTSNKPTFSVTKGLTIKIQLIYKAFTFNRLIRYLTNKKSFASLN